MLREVERHGERRELERAVVEAAQALMARSGWKVYDEFKCAVCNGPSKWDQNESFADEFDHYPNCPAIALEQALAALDKIDQ